MYFPFIFGALNSNFNVILFDTGSIFRQGLDSFSLKLQFQIIHWQLISRGGYQARKTYFTQYNTALCREQAAGKDGPLAKTDTLACPFWVQRKQFPLITFSLITTSTRLDFLRSPAIPVFVWRVTRLPEPPWASYTLLLNVLTKSAESLTWETKSYPGWKGDPPCRATLLGQYGHPLSQANLSTYKSLGTPSRVNSLKARQSGHTAAWPLSFGRVLGWEGDLLSQDYFSQRGLGQPERSSGRVTFF